MRIVVAALALFLAAIQPAAAEVVSAAPTGFTVRHTAALPVSPNRAWRALARIGAWWSDAHTWSGAARNMRLDARAGGCFCERWDGNSVEHARVIVAHRNTALRLRGELGPLQEMGVFGVLSFTMAEADGRTTLTMTYIVTGGGMDLSALASIVDQVLGEQFARLSRYAETGSPS